VRNYNINKQSTYIAILSIISIIVIFFTQGYSSASETRDYVRSRSVIDAASPSDNAKKDIYGLVIGINEYDSPFPSLEGAVNDADDVADALRKRKARRIWLLENKEATRDHIITAWHELAATAKAGDIVIIHVASHGARSPEKISGTGTRGLDEFVVLPTFKTEGVGTRERIINKEWGGLLRDVPQLEIVFVADTCHSGSMTRGFKPRKLKTRLLSKDAIQIQNDAIPTPDPNKWVVAPEKLSHVVFFGAVGQDEEVPEIVIDGKTRGALSWAVANGLRGAADLNKDSFVTKDELVTYVRENVITQTEGEQHPHITPGNIGLNLVVDSSSAIHYIPPSLSPLTLEILNTTKVSPSDLVKDLHNVILAKDGQAADLTWDVSQGKLRNQMQDTLIFPNAGSGEKPSAPAEEATRDYRRVTSSERDAKSDIPRIQSAIDKRSLALWLAKLSESQPLSIALNPKDTLQHKNDHADLTISGNNYPFLTVVNIGPSGNINLIYPVQGDPLEIPKGKPYKLELTADEPFGSEHFVGIASDKALTTFHKGLASIDGKLKMDEFKSLITDVARGVKFQMGIHTVFTSP